MLSVLHRVVSVSGLLMAFAVAAQAQERFSCETLEVVSGNPEYPPLLWQSSQTPGLLTGAVPQLLREIAEPLGIRVKVRDIGSWARVPKKAACWNWFQSIRAGTLISVDGTLPGQPAIRRCRDSPGLAPGAWIDRVPGRHGRGGLQVCGPGSPAG